MPLNPDQEDAIREVINIGIGRAASTLSELIGTRIEMGVPSVRLRFLEAGDDVAEAASPPCLDVAFVQDFRGDLCGRSALVLPHASGPRLAQLLGDVSEPVDGLDLELSGILTEVGNIMLNNVLGALANIVGSHLSYSVPHFFSARPADSLFDRAARGSDALLTADAEFWVKHDNIRGLLLVAMEIRGFAAILELVCGGVGA